MQPCIQYCAVNLHALAIFSINTMDPVKLSAKLGHSKHMESIAQSLRDMSIGSSYERSQSMPWQPYTTVRLDANPNFYHTPEYEKLCLQALQKDAPGLVVIPIHGMEGTGKSALARQFMAQHFGTFDYVAWLVADTEQNLKNALKEEAIDSMAIICGDKGGLEVDTICKDFMRKLHDANPSGKCLIMVLSRSLTTL